MEESYHEKGFFVCLFFDIYAVLRKKLHFFLGGGGLYELFT